jgi:ATP-dependent DNA helicase RecQ
VLLVDALPNGRTATSELMARLRGQHKHHSGLLYCATRAACESLATQLREAGVSAAAYHAGLSTADRAAAQRD